MADAGRREQLEPKLKDEPWEEVAVFAAYCCQCDALNLKPRQEPPMHASDERPSDASPLSAISPHGNCGAGSSLVGVRAGSDPRP